MNLERHVKDSNMESYFKTARSVIQEFKFGQTAIKTTKGEGFESFQAYYAELFQDQLFSPEHQQYNFIDSETIRAAVSASIDSLSQGKAISTDLIPDDTWSKP
jgi:hypothetical protein